MLRKEKPRLTPLQLIILNMIPYLVSAASVLEKQICELIIFNGPP